MTQTITHATPKAIQTILTTELNSLANNTNSAASAAYDNSSDLHLVADVELVVTYGSSPSAGGAVDIFLLERVDGTNFTDTDHTSGDPWVTIPLQATTSAQRIGRRDLPIPPEQFKLFARNRAGQAMAASGNTVKIRPHSILAT